ncbi:Dam family site-specific DNA-(adenine-N6)-methyltransferase [Dyella halodurans]|uniref:Site-specific DNA-methyltransferase (adenine-specific) n=1 Tax=Dyella halodurans TaxID=1920171 RepID=A0ABV9BWQ6_9GAMM|nr:Dam family site-specific DNA-(adenine-N6)-methyltransferase [Dyella halodurans]
MPGTELQERDQECRPLLRWAGSKRQFLPELVRQSPKSFAAYVEPFAGSASLFFALTPREAVLGDVNTELMNFYVQLRASPSELHAAASTYSQEAADYSKYRQRFNSPCDPLEKAALFWYLNRTCFNGLYRTNQAGEFNVPIGRKLSLFPSLQQVWECAEVMSTAHLVCGDFAETIDLADRGDFLYIDPPYHRVSNRDRGEYGPDAMKDDELGRLIESTQIAATRGAKILFSYNVDLSSELRGWRKHLVRGRYVIGANANDRKMISEYIFCNY